MLGKLDIGRLMARDFLSESRNDSRMFALLLGVELKLGLQITDVALSISLGLSKGDLSLPR